MLSYHYIIFVSSASSSAKGQDSLTLSGVMKTEIDPLHPKVRVLGNVNPQILIKKLSKVGKHAELISGYEEPIKVKSEMIETETAKEKKEKLSKLPADACAIYKTGKTKDIITQEEERTKEINQMTVKANYNNNHPQDLKKEESDFKVHSDSYMQPFSNSNNNYNNNTKTHLHYYAIPSCVEVNYHYDHKPRLIHEPPLMILRPTMKVEDYFSDDNTVGCHVM